MNPASHPAIAHQEDFMVRRNVQFSKQISFSLLTFGFLAFGNFAVAEEVTNTADEVTAVPEALVAAPVVVNSSLNPETVPLRSTEAVTTELRSSGASSTINTGELRQAEQSNVFDALSDSADGVSTSANRNATGTQIVINNNQDQKAASQNGNANENGLVSENQLMGADALRRERMRQELRNEGRLLEKIEEGRINSELKRSDTIEGVDFSAANGANSNNLETSQVAAVSVDGPAQVQVAQVANSGIGLSGSTETTSDSRSSFLSNGNLTFSAGYRWMPQDDRTGEYDIMNLGYFNVAFGSNIASFFGLEASVGYGRDRFDSNYNYSYYEIYRSRDVFDVATNAKIGMLKGRTQAYVLGGIGAIHQRYNIDDQYTTEQAEFAGWTRTSTRLMSNLGIGLEYAMNRNMGIGARFEWNHILNGKSNPMDAIWGDSHDRMKIMGGLQLRF